MKSYFALEGTILAWARRMGKAINLCHQTANGSCQRDVYIVFFGSEGALMRKASQMGWPFRQFYEKATACL